MLTVRNPQSPRRCNLMLMGSAIALLTLLAGCKIQIDVPASGGRVSTTSGAYTCATGESCVIDVSDDSFDETFEAVPFNGNRFVAWRTRHGGFCGGSSEPCRLLTTGFPGTPLEPFLQRDDTFFLEPIFARPESYTRKAAMPTSRLFIDGCTLNGQIYIAGGQQVGLGTTINRFEAYEPATDRWVRLANLPSASGGYAAASLRGRCYVIGGGIFPGAAATSSVFAYAPKHDEWDTLNFLPQPRAFAAAAVVSGKIYLFGGTRTVSFSGPAVNDTLEYDPATDTWRTLAPMPTARYSHAAVAVDGQIYVIGGQDGSVGVAQYSVVERYDPASDSWETMAPLRQARHSLAAAAVDGEIFVFGGRGGGSTIYSSAERYLPGENAWRALPALSSARWGMTASSFDGQIHVFGGSTESGAGHNSLSDNDLYTP